MTKIAALILAAGASKRFGEKNKLCAKFNGKPVLSHVLDKAASLGFAKRLVVMRMGDAEVAALCDPRQFELIENPDADAGMGSSIALGAKQLDGMGGVMIMLGDMPSIHQRTYKTLLNGFYVNGEETMIAPTYNGKRGHPVLFKQQHFSALAALSGDQGAKTIIDTDKSNSRLIFVDDPGVLYDVDIPADLEAD